MDLTIFIKIDSSPIYWSCWLYVINLCNFKYSILLTVYLNLFIFWLVFLFHHDFNESFILEYFWLVLFYVEILPNISR